MDGAVDLLLDGGTVAGAGATTIDVTEVFWRVIKEGAIAEKDIAEVLKGDLARSGIINQERSC